jgi:hypothetical protein
MRVHSLATLLSSNMYFSTIRMLFIFSRLTRADKPSATPASTQ